MRLYVVYVFDENFEPYTVECSGLVLCSIEDWVVLHKVIKVTGITKYLKDGLDEIYVPQGSIIRVEVYDVNNKPNLKLI